MNLTVMQDDLKRGLALVSHAVTSKSLPVLAHVLLTTDGERLKLAATNLEVGITQWIEAEIVEAGAITVPAKLLSDVIGSVPNAPVTITLDDRTQTVAITCGRFTTHIRGIEADEFPSIPQPKGLGVPIPASALTSSIEHVAFAASADDSRPVLAGVFLRLRDTHLVMTATDGFRLATRTIALPDRTPLDATCIIPAKALSMVGKVFASERGSVTVSMLETQIVVEGESTHVISRLIDGRFPDVERIIPTHHTTRTVIETAALAKAVKLASYFVADHAVVKLTMEPGGDRGPGRCVISANAADVGDNTGELDGLITGDGGQIALNVTFMADLLAAVKSPQIAFETQGAQRPSVFRPIGSDDYAYVIMPMALR